MLVDTRATSHIIMDIEKFKICDFVEVAHGTGTRRRSAWRIQRLQWTLVKDVTSPYTRPVPNLTWRRLYYVNTENFETDDNAFYYNQIWHGILGHCNYDDVSQLEKLIELMKIKGKVDKSNLNCEVFKQGKGFQSRNREPDERIGWCIHLLPHQLTWCISYCKTFHMQHQQQEVFGLQ